MFETWTNLISAGLEARDRSGVVMACRIVYRTKVVCRLVVGFHKTGISTNTGNGEYRIGER